MRNGALPNARQGQVDKEGRLRRLAIQLAAQLPEDVGEAAAVLRYTQELVDSFLRPAGDLVVKNVELRVVKPDA